VEDRWHASSGFIARSPEHWTSGFAISRNPKSRRGDGTVEKSKPRAHRSFGISGLEESENRVARHRECRDPNREGSDRVKEKVSDDCIDTRGFESAALDHWTREVTSSDSPISKERGITRRDLWVQISR
jgi:hypothetical protein